MGEELTTQPAVQTVRLCRWKVPSPPCIGNCERTHVRPRQTKSFGSRYARLLGFRWGLSPSVPRCSSCPIRVTFRSTHSSRCGSKEGAWRREVLRS